MKLLFSLFITHFLLYGFLFGQKKIIDQNAYNSWKKTSNVQLSKNGNIVSFETKPHRGDGYLYIYQNEEIDSFFLGEKADISSDELFVAFSKTPGFDTLRKCELNEISKKKWPKNELNIYSILEDSLIKFEKVDEWKLGENSNRIAFIQDKDVLNVDELVRNWSWFGLIKPKKEENKSSKGNNLLVRYDNKEFKEEYVTKFNWSEKGKQIAFIQHEKKDDEDSYKLVIKKSDSIFSTVFESANYRDLALPSWNTDQSKILFFASQDTSEEKQMNLISYDIQKKQMSIIGDLVDPELDTTLGISKEIKPFFLENSNKAFIGITKRLIKTKDTLLEKEKPKLDVWHYKDPDLQPRQLLRAKNKRNDAHYFLFDTDTKSLTQITNDTLKARPNRKQKSDFQLGFSNESYAIQSQWSIPWLNDYYLVDTKTGTNQLLKKAVAYPYGLSIQGKYFAYFEPSEKQHYIIDTESKEELCLTCNYTDVDWCEDINGQPHLAGPKNTYGFDKAEQTYFFQSAYDIWAYDIPGKNLHCLTQRKGEKNKIEFDLRKWHSDSAFIDLKDVYLLGIHEKTKENFIYELYDKEGDFGLFKKFGGSFGLGGIQKSDVGNKMIARISAVNQYPEVSLFEKDFQNERILSSTNPQQENYNWAFVEQVSWYNPDSVLLDGLVYLPENFDRNKTYPLLVYFYELSSHRVHNYLMPKPSASVINPVEYASAGYLVFIPDIRYTHPGKPAKSAYSCIVSGTDFIASKYPVDTLRMGLQGQSWGGYQTAQLITMTKKYAAAMAGAPVSNMFSAYGGIRWGSGLNRQFQYESTQSRIGKSIWEAPELYIENSPLFHLPNVKTPLLIMHNDEDGAVPWYQGIELYNGMRRLQKPCWMLTYNGDDHNLMKNANRMDLSIRMRQFFDHFLQNKPIPHWMKYGVSAKEKGKIRGYETEN